MVMGYVILRLRALLGGIWQSYLFSLRHYHCQLCFTLLLGITTLVWWRLQVTGWSIKKLPTFIVVL